MEIDAVLMKFEPALAVSIITSTVPTMEPGNASSPAKPKEQRRKRRFDQQFAVFEVEGTVYRELRYGFEKWSDSPFPDMFGISEGRTAEPKLGSDENPIRLSGCTTDEFDSLLEVMYATDEPTASLDKDEWIGVLKLARLWDMPQLAVMAVDQIGPNLSPIEKITMGKASAHRVSRWVREGYTTIIGDLNNMTLEGLAADVGWETAARVLWALKKVCFEAHPPLTKLGAGDVVDKIIEEDFDEEDLAETEAGLRSMYLEAIPSPLRITVTQELPVPRRAGTASIITFSPDGVYVSRDHLQAPTRVLQDFGYDAGGWRVEKHVRLVGDTTGCGRSDIIGFGNSGVYISRNNGDGTFTPARFALNSFGYDSGWRVDKHLRYVVDLRKKGYADIIGFGDGGVYVALNRGNGTFSAPKIVLPEFGYDAGGWRLDRHLRFLADVTGNGLPDIIAFGEDAVRVALNNGDGTFQKSKVAIEKFTPKAGGWLVEKHPRTVGDLTGDGRADIVGFFDDGVYLSLNAGDGTFHPPKLVVSELSYSRGGWRVESNRRFVADVTGDGRCDIVGFGGNQVYVALNNGDGTFQPIKAIVQGFGLSAGWRVDRHLRLSVDLTGNGSADIVGFGEDAVWVSYNDGKGNFGPLQKLREYRSGDADSRSVDKTVRWVTNLYA